MYKGYRIPHRALLTTLLFACLSILMPHAARAQDNVVTVAAAADMEPVIQVLGPVFEKKFGAKLRVSFGSSAALEQQIKQGLPVDIFLSADYYFAEQLVADNLTETKSPTPYARGLIGLWARKGSRFKPLTIDVLQRHDLKTVAIANPDRAPYGRAAVAALQKLTVYDNVKPHLVQAESVAQAAQFGLSGNAELALISQTIAMTGRYKAEGDFVLFPLSQYPEIRQCAVILKGAKNTDGAHRFLHFLLSDEVQGNLPKLGLQAAQ